MITIELLVTGFLAAGTVVLAVYGLCELALRFSRYLAEAKEAGVVNTGHLSESESESL